MVTFCLIGGKQNKSPMTNRIENHSDFIPEKKKCINNCNNDSQQLGGSNNSTIKVMPVLLIDEFDVSANHGCAIGKIDEEGLYYLMSRGISKKDAEMLIIKGFLSPILNGLSNEEVKDELIKLQDSKL